MSFLRLLFDEVFFILIITDGFKNAMKLLKKKTLIYSMNKKLDKYNDNKSVEKIYKLSIKLIGK